MIKMTEKEFTKKQVKQQGFALEYASKELQADKEVVMEALKKDISAIKYVSEEQQAKIIAILNNYL
jgi:hypothetical protein